MFCFSRARILQVGVACLSSYSTGEQVALSDCCPGCCKEAVQRMMRPADNMDVVLMLASGGKIPAASGRAAPKTVNDGERIDMQCVVVAEDGEKNFGPVCSRGSCHHHNFRLSLVLTSISEYANTIYTLFRPCCATSNVPERPHRKGGYLTDWIVQR